MKTLATTLTILTLTAATSFGEIVEFNFPINVEQAVPTPVIPDGFDPSGTGSVVIDTDTNALSWEVSYQGLTGGIVPPGAHFHGPADFGETAGVEVFLSDGDPAEPATGTLIGNETITDQQKADLLAGLWYVNIHTDLNQPGEIRGQVVPEPASLLGLALLGALGLRRR